MTALCRDRSGDRGKRKDVRADDDGLRKHWILECKEVLHFMFETVSVSNIKNFVYRGGKK